MLFDPMFTMGGDMDNILDYMNTPLTMTPFNRKRRSMMGPSLTSGSLVDNQSFHIPLDVYESDKQYVILAQIPGILYFTVKTIRKKIAKIFLFNL